MPKYVIQPARITEALWKSSKFQGYLEAFRSMTREEFVSIAVRDCSSFVERKTDIEIKVPNIRVTWDEKDWAIALKIEPRAKNRFGVGHLAGDIFTLYAKPEAAKRWFSDEKYAPYYLFRFIFHELFEVLVPQKTEQDTLKFTDIVVMENFWGIKLSDDEKKDIKRQIETICR